MKDNSCAVYTDLFQVDFDETDVINKKINIVFLFPNYMDNTVGGGRGMGLHVCVTF